MKNWWCQQFKETILYSAFIHAGEIHAGETHAGEIYIIYIVKELLMLGSTLDYLWDMGFKFLWFLVAFGVGQWKPASKEVLK